MNRIEAAPRLPLNINTCPLPSGEKPQERVDFEKITQKMLLILKKRGEENINPDNIKAVLKENLPETPKEYDSSQERFYLEKLQVLAKNHGFSLTREKQDSSFSLDKFLAAPFPYLPVLPDSTELIFTVIASLKSKPYEIKAKTARAWLTLANAQFVLYKIKQFPLVNYSLYQQEGDNLYSSLFQEGIKGLIEAIDKFEWQQGNKLSTYASDRIERNIRNFLITKGGQLKRRIVDTTQPKIQAMYHCNGLSLKEIAGKIHLPLESIQLLLNSAEEFALPFNPDDVDSDFNLDEHLSLASVFSQDHHQLPLRPVEEKAIQIISQENLLAIIGNVIPDPRIQTALILRFGFDGKGSSTLEEIGKKIGVSREWVRRIINQGLEELKKNLTFQQKTGIYLPIKR